MILCDTGPLVAACNAADRDHARCTAFLRENWSRLVVPSLMLRRIRPPGVPAGSRGKAAAAPVKAVTDPANGVLEQAAVPHVRRLRPGGRALRCAPSVDQSRGSYWSRVRGGRDRGIRSIVDGGQLE